VEKTQRSLTVYIDGASKGNPGPAGIGAAIYNQKGELVKEIIQQIGITTNNVAEYMALIFALQESLLAGCRDITIYTDSELLSRQIKGSYKVKDKVLKILHTIVRHLLGSYHSYKIERIDRENNREADKLANKAIP